MKDLEKGWIKIKKIDYLKSVYNMKSEDIIKAYKNLLSH